MVACVDAWATETRTVCRSAWLPTRILLEVPCKDTLLRLLMQPSAAFTKLRRAGVGQKFSRDLGRLSLLPTETSRKERALRGLVPVNARLVSEFPGL